MQKEILSQTTFTNFENSQLKILDLKSIANLKLVALIIRDKSRDLFDFSSILVHNVLNKVEFIELFNKVDNKINSIEDIINFIILNKNQKMIKLYILVKPIELI
jgi:uncharacterized protein with PQ loop repeat